MTIVKDAGLARASMPLELKAGGSEGTFEGYGAIFGNVDRDGDTVARGAFAESLKARLPMLLWQHDTKAPIGRFDEVREDERGLYVRGRLSMSGRGAEAYELLKMGALDGLSIGFVTREATRDSATGTRTILKADCGLGLWCFARMALSRCRRVQLATPRLLPRHARPAHLRRYRHAHDRASIDARPWRPAHGRETQRRQPRKMEGGVKICMLFVSDCVQWLCPAFFLVQLEGMVR